MRKSDLNDVVVVGRSCRLPGASSVDALWDNLLAGRCSVTEIPDDRWSKAKHGHPRPKEPGKSYTWAAGILDDIWSFDPSVFGISPREAEQMDPQQRLLLELTWEAMEDAGLRRSALAGRDVGVFVGASSPEYTVVRNSDIAGGDAYTATGGAISIISNRISHAFDFQGPSFTVDTACSSSLVALHQAMEALRSGRIDTAIVGGINLFMSPFGFVVFSQASMLSPDGLCQTFDSRANGYVRSEGAVVLVLQTEERSRQDETRAYARIAASGVNSDGRTNGIALPSRFAQGKLLKQVYADAGIRPDQMAFVEAHGTGTRVGDPIEAHTIGQVLGQSRTSPLLVGSIKSNIGHLEPASGLAGMLKAMLALEHDLLPASVHYREPNPDIPFGELNLQVCAQATVLPRRDGPRYAGINSFGFGGTNAHVVIADPPTRPVVKRKRLNGSAGRDRFVIAGATPDAVRDLARRHSARLAAASSDEVREVGLSAAHRRDMLSERLVVEWDSPRDLARKLEKVADKDGDVPGVTWGSAIEPDAPVCFVFSGNGGQWPGMGRGAYATNKRFREAFDEVDAQFDQQFGWSVTEALFAPDLEERLRFTHVAQPLIFAVQIATARALAGEGIVPSVVLGHSVGEIAAAAVGGALSLKDAVRVIHARSHHQELARDTGRMAVVVGSLDAVAELVDEVRGVEIAAFNSPRAFTVAGPTDQIKALGARARKRRMVFRQLDLDYPFHCGLIDPVREPLARDLAGLKPAAAQATFISTVTAEPLEGPEVDAEYWWRNVREPVRFSAAVERAARDGARVFIEIGPRSVLLSNIGETVEALSLPFAALGVLEKREDESRDPIGPAAIAAFAKGAAADLDKLLGPAPAEPARLPTYPWQRRDFRVSTTPEAVGFTLDTRWHRLVGGRATADGVEWTGQLDTQAIPELGDHLVGGQPIFPAAGFIEIALAVARDWFETENAALLDLDIALPLALEHDRAKEVRARLSPNTNTVEIMSRPRLAKSGWTIHATAKITAGSDEPLGGTLPTEPGERFDTAAVYAVAERVGLHYGPTFRLLRSVRRSGDAALVVELEPSAPIFDYRLDPHRLDACFHGLFALFSELDAGRRGTAYLPVRFGHIRLARPGAAPASALIEIRKAGERSILSDFTLFDAAGVPIAKLDDVRFQAARLSRAATLSERALVLNERPADGRTLGRGGAGIGADAVLSRLAETGRLVGAAVEDTEQQMLLEGWATSAAIEVAHGLFPGGTVASSDLGALTDDRSAWLSNLLHTLEMSGLATATDTGWTLSSPGSVPQSALILRTLAAEAPERSAELVLAASLTSHLRGESLETLADIALGSGAVDGFELGGTAVRAAGDLVAAALEAAGLTTLDDRAISLLQVGYGPLSHSLAAKAETGRVRLTVLELDERRLERAKLSLSSVSGVFFAGSVEDLGDASFDVLVAAERLHRLGDAGMAALRGRLAEGGVLVAVEPAPSQFRDLTLGLGAGWFEAGATAGFPIGPLRSSEQWVAALGDAGFGNVRAVPVATGPEASLMIVGYAGVSRIPAVTVERSVRIHAPTSAAALVTRLDALLALDGHQVSQLSATIDRSADPADTILFVVDTDRASRSDTALVHANGMALKALAAEHCQREKTELWIVAQSASGDHPQADPVAAALLGFARTLANETAAIRVRRVAIASGVAPDAAAETLRALLAAEQTETDFAIDRDGCRVLRIETVGAGGDTSNPAAAAQLERGTTGGLSGLEWVGIDRCAPGAGEVEIHVEASGLNFRDVMWAMSLLPDDILEDGFAGPTLGLEGAGKVTAVGAGVTRVKLGDRVLAFMPSAFATTVCVPQSVVTHVPEGVSTEAAATIPVAFLTAYYGLVTLAGLRRGEWVLIHGAAGGVGLAAVQIAQHRGANVIATAGSREKRELLAALGVEHVLNSRSSAFADDLKAINAPGVDVVLNSLAGEAMERSLSTLKPFGRFIELGKRDYVANTRIGLRPFRRNLSYFGVDVDQLLSDRDRASEIFAEVIALFDEGVYRPLPYRVFPADETVDAFRLMQQSGHVGKIVVRPPTVLPPRSSEEEFRFDPARTHLLTGGFGGFGLETARWLVDRGVRHLVMTGRSGAASEDAQALVAELRARGVSLKVASCDVADERSLSALLADLRRDMPPLAGILHAAMVLEDSLLANMTDEQFTSVLGPKVTGAALLDRLTRSDRLDYFILFSSITTFVGNPGQAAYVAANAYLEGLARRRREEGRPALALAWGAISDVGVLARQKGLAEALAKRVGVKAMPAREALDLMVQALGRDPKGVENAVIAIGSLDWSAARRLPALGSPTFASLIREGGAIETSERGSVDLRALVATKEPEAVRKEVVGVIVEEIATVLRVPKGDVAMGKRLAEIGLDSLMAIELATALQERFELSAPPTGSVGTLTVPGLAEHIIQSVQTGAPDEEARVTQALQERHGGDEAASAATLEVLKAVQERSAAESRGVLQ